MIAAHARQCDFHFPVTSGPNKSKQHTFSLTMSTFSLCLFEINFDVEE